MTQRTLTRKTIRILIVLITAFGAVTFPSGSIILWTLFGAFLALDGPWRTFVPFVAVAIGTELISGVGFGTLSLPFALVTLLFTVSGRFVTIGPWAIADHWYVAGLIRNWLVAAFAGILMVVVSALGLAVFRGYPIGLVLTEAVAPVLLVRIGAAAFLFLIILRRIDVPFTRSTEFGI